MLQPIIVCSSVFYKFQQDRARFFDKINFFKPEKALRPPLFYASFLKEKGNFLKRLNQAE